jgi:drug/metabolite transporter (DMT)-like permease
MGAVAGGLGAALIWAVGAVFASRAARDIGSVLTLAWVMLTGLLVLGCVLPWSGVPHLSALAVLWLVLGGAGNMVGLLLLYRALRIGQLGVVTPIVSAEGGVAALLAIAAGQPISGLRGLALTMVLTGVVMTARTRRGEAPLTQGDRGAPRWAVAAALSMGVSLFATGRAGGLLPAAWAVLPPRLMTVAAVAVPLGLTGRLRLPPGRLPTLAIAGLCEVGGFLAYALGARDGIAIAAVLASLAGAFAAGLGRLLFGERLGRTQIFGVATIVVGVSLLSALTA